MPNKSVAFYFWMNNKSVAVITTLVEASYETWVKLSKQKNISFLCKACRKASDWQRKRKVDGGVGGSRYRFFCGFEYFFHWEFGRWRRHEEFRNLVIFINFFFLFLKFIYIYIYIFFFLTYRTEFIYLLVHFAPRFYKIK